MSVILAILWGILKWILIMILAIVGLILVALLIILFTSLRYRVSGEYNARNAHGELRLSYFLHLFRVKVWWKKGEKLQWEARIGPKVVVASYELAKKKKRRFRKKEKKAEMTPVTEERFERPARNEAPTKIESPAQSEAKPEPGGAEEQSQMAEGAAQLERVQEEKLFSSHEEKAEKQRSQRVPPVRRLIEHLRAVWKRLKAWISRIVTWPHRLCEKWMRQREKWEELRRKWESYPQKAETVKAVKDVVVGLIKPVLPRHFWAEVRFGFSDPATTGKVLGYYYAIYPLLVPKETRRKRLWVEADFKQPILEVKGELDGHVAPIELVVVLVRALLNPHIRRLIRYIRTKQNKEN